MSNYGSNHFVIEGINGKNLYEKIMNSVEKCVEFKTRYIIDKIAGKTYTIEKEVKDDKVEYILCVWEGDIIDGSNFPIVWSWFYLNNIKFKNEYLSICENFCHGFGGIQNYILDTKLYESGFYYISGCESDICGCTNDKFQKYFKRGCYIFEVTSNELRNIRNEELELRNRFFPKDFDNWDIKDKIAYNNSRDLKEYYDEVEKINKKYWSLYPEVEEKYIPVDFDEWTFEEQLSYCESHSENLLYETTRICEFA